MTHYSLAASRAPPVSAPRGQTCSGFQQMARGLVYVLLHFAVNGLLRMFVHRKTAV